MSSLERALERARSQLSQVVNVALSDGLEAIGDRLPSPLRPSSSLLAQVDSQVQAHGFRLREVIERDRALVASSSPSAQPVEGHAVARETEDEPVAEPALGAPSELLAEQDASDAAALSSEAPTASVPLLRLDVPFVASAAVEVLPRAEPQAAVRCDEPIRTRTMAKLLASQGHRLRALSIYDLLISRSPGDEGLKAEAEVVRASE